MTRFPKWFGQGLFALAMALSGAAMAQDALDVRALQAAVAAERAQPRAAQQPRIAFLASSSLQGAWLSPDGRRVAWLRDAGRNRSLWIASTTGAPVRTLANTDAQSLAWSRDGRWLFLQSEWAVFALAM